MLIRRLLLAVPLLLAAGVAAAADWPTHPVRVIVPFAAGGSGDAAARPYAERLSQALGQQFVVENRAGAGGAIGVESVVKAAPDGYTVLFASSSPLQIGPKLRAVPYNVEKDLRIVARLADSIAGFAVAPDVPAKTLQELIALAKAKPGTLTFGSAGIGSSTQLCSEAFKGRTGIDIVHVPYKGVGEAIVDLLAGHIQILCDVVVLPHAKAGKLKLLAVSADQRHPDFPDIPTMAEAGVPGPTVPITFSAYVPAATPVEIATRLNAEIVKIAKDPDFAKRMLATGLIVATETPTEAAEHAKRDDAVYAKVIKDGNITMD